MMMTAPKRISVKLLVENPQDVNHAGLVPVFQRWIQQHTVEGLLIDVAVYEHVYNGPGTILIAHEGDFVYTGSDGRDGLQYVLKTSDAETLTDAVAIALRRAVDAAEKLQNEPELGGIRLNFCEIQIAILDRLNYPNQPEIVTQVQEVIQAQAKQLTGSEVTVQVASDDVRQPITVVLQLETPITSEQVSRLVAAQVG
jgi:hypothetical protein